MVVREGEVARQAFALAEATRCDEVFLTSDVSPHASRREERIEQLCAPLGIKVRTFPGNAVVEPGLISPQGRDAYRVFTPYHRAWAELGRRPILDAPKAVRTPPDIDPGRLPQPSGFRPTARDLPPGGEQPARKRMRRFLAEGTGRYAAGRNVPAEDSTSGLSPYLRFGCVSANELATRAGGVTEGTGFVRQLVWRDFFRQLLAAEPSMTWRDLRDGPTVREGIDDTALEAWEMGRTGFPLVDAGMRQLHREGWMHNRVRLVTASFLTRTLGIPWQQGARHFSLHLVDGDPATNAGNWQWVAGTGPASRRSHPMNPVRQALRFDPTGAYVRRYVPELTHVDDITVFRPWRDEELLRATGYPAPIIDVPGT